MTMGYYDFVKFKKYGERIQKNLIPISTKIPIVVLPAREFYLWICELTGKIPSLDVFSFRGFVLENTNIVDVFYCYDIFTDQPNTRLPVEINNTGILFSSISEAILFKLSYSKPDVGLMVDLL